MNPLYRVIIFFFGTIFLAMLILWINSDTDRKIVCNKAKNTCYLSSIKVIDKVKMNFETKNKSEEIKQSYEKKIRKTDKEFSISDVKGYDCERKIETRTHHSTNTHMHSHTTTTTTYYFANIVLNNGKTIPLHKHPVDIYCEAVGKTVIKNINRLPDEDIEIQIYPSIYEISSNR